MGTIILLLVLWTLPWKGVALWKAARNSHQKWFISLLVINTLAHLNEFADYYTRLDKLEKEAEVYWKK
jgi:hypothetical protein